MQKFIAVSFEGLDLFLLLCFFIGYYLFLRRLVWLSTISFCLGSGFRHFVNRLFSLRLSFDKLSFKWLVTLFIHHFISIIVNILFLIYLFRVIHNHIVFHIEFGHVKFNIVGLFHGIFHVLLDFFLQKSCYWVFE